MRHNGLKQLASQRTTAINAWLSSDSGYVAEVLGHCGFDAVTVDLQHGQFGIDAVPRLLQAISATPAMPWVRCSGNDMAELNKLLDMGAYGVICPMIETVEQARQLVSATRYAPLGRRSFGPARGLLYGGSDYLAHANEEVLVLAMIETQDGLENAEEILQVPGLDGIYIGPNDLALSLGISPATPWQESVLADHIHDLLELCQRYEKYSGIFCGDLAMAHAMQSAGVSLVTPGNDTQLMRSEAMQRIQMLREAS
ncbi:MAG: 2,4-dihydroxyhept-2-ene-1,7-dioic acid aldolase [Halomonas sp.]|nr:2,4-dihydroxyhept-2-ene-1,7-dioic acid aldolase [Halomonas sp.]|tara:strand:- start:5693 stop:6457 length:765 start_codon:yes stop_codon:yes gene_type:complete